MHIDNLRRFNIDGQFSIIEWLAGAAVKERSIHSVSGYAETMKGHLKFALMDGNGVEVSWSSSPSHEDYTFLLNGKLLDYDGEEPIPVNLSYVITYLAALRTVEKFKEDHLK